MVQLSGLYNESERIGQKVATSLSDEDEIAVALVNTIM
jgi:hypothetical protein